MEKIAIKQRRISVSDTSILLTFAIFAAISIMADNNFVNPPWWSLAILNLLIVCTIVALVINLVSYSITIREFFLIVLILFLSMLTLFTTRNSTCAFNLIWIFILRKVNVKAFVQTILITNVIVFFLTWLSYEMGITADFAQSILGKHSLGFGNPNTLGQVAAIIIISALSLQMKKQINKIVFFSINLFAMMLLYVSGSRGGLIISIVAYVVYIGLKWSSSLARRQKILSSIYLFILIATISFSFYSTGASVLRAGSFLNLLDQVFTNRIRLNNYFMTQYGWSWFGQRVEYSYGSSIGLNIRYAVLDNGILKSFINYGFLYTFSIFTLVYGIGRKMIKFGQDWFLIPLISFCIYGFVEQAFDIFYVNFTIALIGCLFNSKETFIGQVSIGNRGNEIAE